MISLVQKEEKEGSPNRILRSCLNVFDSVIVAGYSLDEDNNEKIQIYACEGITEERMALISLKLARLSEMGWVDSDD